MNHKDLYNAKSDKVFAVFTRSNGFIARAIRYFSKRMSGLNEFDHCVLVHRGLEYHATNPTVEVRTFRRRSYNEVYEVVTDKPLSAVREANRFLDRQDKYGYVQLVSMLLKHYTGWHPIKAGQVCSEFLARCIVGRNEPWMESYTVGQVAHRLATANYIRYLGKLEK